MAASISSIDFALSPVDRIKGRVKVKSEKNLEVIFIFLFKIKTMMYVSFLLLFTQTDLSPHQCQVGLCG